MPPKPPAKSITSLNQIDIRKMDINELQNIDYQKLLSGVGKKPDTAISIVLVLLGILFSFNLLMKSQSEKKAIQNKIVEMQTKLEIVTQYKKAEEELENFIKNQPPKMTEDGFINKITDFAVKNSIQIESFSPAQNKSDPVYDLTSINLTASAADFNDVGLFIKDIENSKSNIRINNWSGNMGVSKNASRINEDTAQSRVNFRLDIALVTFKQ